jgi:hypothetical protein
MVIMLASRRLHVRYSDNDKHDPSMSEEQNYELRLRQAQVASG